MYVPLHNSGVLQQISDFSVLKLHKKYAVRPEQK